MTDFLGTCIDLGVKIKSNFEQAGQNRNDCSALSADIVDSLNQIVETLQHHMLAPPDELRDNISQFENELRSILSRQQRLYKQSKNGVWGSSMKKIQEFYYADDIKNQLVELRQNLQTCNQRLQLSSTLRVEGRVATVSNQVISLQQKQEAMLNLLESLVPGSNPTRVAALSRIEEVMEDRRSVIEYDGTLQPPQEVAYGSITSRNDSLAALSIVNSISSSHSIRERLFLKDKVKQLSGTLPQVRGQGIKPSTLARLNPFRDLAVWEHSYPSRLDRLDSIQETLRILNALRSERMEDIEIAKELIGLARILGDSDMWEEAGIVYDWGIQICCEIVENGSSKIIFSLVSFIHKVFSDIAHHGRTEDAQKVAEQAVALYRVLGERAQKGYLEKLAKIWAKSFSGLSSTGPADTSVVAGHQVMEIHRHLVRMDRQAHLADLGSCLHELAVEQVKLERHGEAVKTVEEAVRIRKELVAKDAKTYLPSWVESLHILVTELYNTGKHEDAVRIAEEGIQLLQKSGDRDRKNHFPFLLASLRSLIGELRNASALHDQREEEQAIGLPPAETVQEDGKLALLDPSQSTADSRVDPGDAQREHEVQVPNGEGDEIYRQGGDDSKAHGPELPKSQQISTELFSTEKKTEAFSGEGVVKMGTEFTKVYQEHDLCEVTQSLHNLVFTSSENGELDESLKLRKEVVEMHLKLVESDRQTYLPGLGMSLDNLGYNLGEAKRHSDAVVIYEEAIKIRRELVERDPQTHLPGLGLMLNHLGYNLGEAKRRSDAIVILEEAIKIRRELVEINREIHLPDLGNSLHRLGYDLQKAGRFSDAVTITEEAVTIFRKLVERDRQTYLSGLYHSLHNLGIGLRGAKRHSEATGILEEAIKISRELVERDRQTYLPGLAISVSNLGYTLGEAKRHNDAVVIFEEVIKINRELVERDRQTYLPGLALSVINLGYTLREAKRHNDAVVIFEEVIKINRELVERDRQTYLPGLRDSLYNLGYTLGEAKRHNDAVVIYEEVIKINRELVERDRQTYLLGLGDSLYSLGCNLENVARFDDAVAIAKEAVAILRELVERDHQTYLPILGNSLHNLGRNLEKAGRFDDAVVMYEEVIKICRELIERDRETYLPNLGNLLHRLGYDLAKAGRFGDAVAITKEAVTVRRELAQKDPAKHLSQLTLSLDNLAVHLRLQSGSTQ